MVPGPGSPREPARGRRIGEGGRAGGCATRARQRSIFKAPSGFGQPPALPSLAPARPPPFRAAARRQPPGPPRRRGGASAAPPPPGAPALRAAPAWSWPGTQLPTRCPRFPGLLLSHALGGLLRPAFCPAHESSPLSRACALMQH